MAGAVDFSPAFSRHRGLLPQRTQEVLVRNLFQRRHPVARWEVRQTVRRGDYERIVLALDDEPASIANSDN
jgi:hypothetical protein